MSLRQDLLKTSGRRRRRAFFVRILIGAGVAALAAGIIVVLFFVPSLRIRNVTIAGLNPTDERELKKEILAALAVRKYLILPKDHLILFPKKEIEAFIANKFRVKNFKVEKDFPSGLKISITERETWAVWCPAESSSNIQTGKPNCLLLDQEGLAFEAAPGFTGTAVLKIIDARDKNFLGKNILPAKDFEKIKFFIEKVPGRITEEIKTINIKASGDTYLLYLKSGWYLLVDAQTDPARALENLSIALSSEIKEKRAKLEYIDLRFADKVFYRFK